jgi:hypothetical protein
MAVDAAVIDLAWLMAVVGVEGRGEGRCGREKVRTSKSH